MKVTLNPVFLLIHGKIGKLTGYTGKIGLVLKACVKGLNPQSSYQVARRAQLTAFSQRWQTLSDVNMALWRAAAEQKTYVDPVGESYSPAGFNLFLKINLTFRVYGGLVAIDTPPTMAPATDNGPLADVFTVARPTALIMTADIPAVNVGDVLKIWSTPCFSAGIWNWSGRMRPIKQYPAGIAIVGDDIYPDYIARLSPPVAGQRMAINCSYYNTLDHGDPLFEQELQGKVK